MAKIGKRIKNIKKSVDVSRIYTLKDAISIIKQYANAKFDETIELCLMLGIDTKKPEQNIRGVINLPHGTGKTYRVAVFASGAKANEAKEAGAVIVGAEDLVEMIQKGEMPFDKCVATPDMMAFVGKVGKILGPKGLMPNPKLGTVTNDVAVAVKNLKEGQVEYRTEKGGIIHAGVGKASFSEIFLEENVNALVDTVSKAKPQGIKGSFLKKMSLSSTMGVGLNFIM